MAEIKNALEDHDVGPNKALLAEMPNTALINATSSK
jgi:hypothetical protein